MMTAFEANTNAMNRALMLGPTIANRRSLFAVEASRSSVQSVDFYESDSSRVVCPTHDCGIAARSQRRDNG